MTAAASSSTDASLGSAIFARLHPASYLSRFLSSSIRPDGRSLDTFRSSTLALSTISTAHGSCIVRQGSTVIVAGVKAEILDLSEEEDDNGSDAGEDSDNTQARIKYGLGPVERKRIIVGVELSPMASAKFKPGPPGEESQVLTSRLSDALDSCPPLHQSSLVIAEGISSWCLYVDLVCLSYDGNAFDAALLAINGALQDARLPQASYNESAEQTICSPELSKSASLLLTSCPLSCSFGVIDGRYLLSDLDAFESSLITSTITITLNVHQASQVQSRDDDIVNIHCTGSCSALVTLQEATSASVSGSGEEIGEQVRVRDEDLIAICILRARKRCADMVLLLEKAKNTL